MEKIYITVTHLGEMGSISFRTGDILTLKKDTDNIYDDEAVTVHNRNGVRCGYVANSVHTVARGTYSAGRVYDRIDDHQQCRVCFVLEECLICEIL